MITYQKRHAGFNHRSAFTLVEMLVSVTLVLLIMSLFAAIFGLASSTVKLQRGIASNDQRARALVTIVRNDFEKRTQRYVYPYYPTEDAATSPTPFGTRAGYLYISTNDPSSFYDDLIQFTVDARLVQQDQDDSAYYGAAKLFFDQIAEANGTPQTTGVLASPQQPEADDRDIRLNNVAASSAAEVMMFLRNGNLIRRVSLLRDPGSVESNGLENQPVSGSQPKNDFIVDASDTRVPAGAAGGGRFFYVANPSAVDLSDPTNTNGLTIVNSDDFLTHFDFSARPILSPPAPAWSWPTSAQLLGLDALNNEQGADQFPLGIPHNRWGFNSRTGFSREHTSGAEQVYLGRFVHAETSDPFFNWPLAQSLTAIGNGNPMDAFNCPVTLPRDADVVTEFNGGNTDAGRGGERRVEDVLLTNVHEFRIELWDERLGQYVVPGYGNPTSMNAGEKIGDFHIARSLQVTGNPGGFVNYTWGPLVHGAYGNESGMHFPPLRYNVQPAVFDTWHPEVPDLPGFFPSMTERQPPYLPYKWYPPRQNDSPPGPSSRRAPDNALYPGGPLVTYWIPGQPYNVGDVVFASRKNPHEPGADLFQGWNAVTHNASSFDWQGDKDAIPDQAFHIAYRCVVPGTSDASGPPKPWPITPGRRKADGTVMWEAFDNRRPLTSVRMTIRFKDEASDQIRQLTMILPLADD